MLRALGAVAAVAAMAFGQYQIRLSPDDSRATLLFLAGAAVAALFLGAASADLPVWPAPVRRRPAVRSAAILGVAIGAAAVGGAVCLLSLQWATWFVRGGALLLAGVVLLSVSFGAFDPPRRNDLGWSRGEVFALLLILAIGAFLRFHRFDEFPGPYTLHAIEEPQTGAGGYKIATYGTRPWEFMGDHYLAAFGFWVFGDTTMQSLRLPFVVFSLLAIVPMHLWLRQMVQRPAALAGTFLFAVGSWNLIYSRCAHNIFLTNIVVVANIALLLAYARSGRLALVPWIGLLCGYTLYTYAGYRGTTILSLVFLALLALRHAWRWRRTGEAALREAARWAFRRDILAGTMVVLLAAAIVTPVVVITRTNTAQPNYFFEAAIRSLSNKNYYTSDHAEFVRQRLRRVRDTARIFSHFGDGSNTFNAPNEPMLDPLTAVCFVGGLFVAAFHPGRRYGLFFLFMFVFLVAGSAVFVQNLDVRRMQGVTPLVAVFAAMFLDRLYALTPALPIRVRRGLVSAIAIAGGGFALWWNYDVYFNKMAGNPFVRQSFRNHYTSLVHFGRTAGAGRELLLLTYIKSFFAPSDYFWLVDGRIQGRVLDDLDEILPPHSIPPAARERTVAIQRPYDGAAAGRLLAAVYPGTSCHDFIDSENPWVSIVACDLPARPEAQPLTSSLRARYWIGPSREGAPVADRAEPFIDGALVPRTCHLHVPPETPPMCSGEWVGEFEVPAGSDIDLRLVPLGAAQITATLDGERFEPGAIRPVGAGSHRIVVQAQWPRAGDSGVRLERVVDGVGEALPFYRIG